MEANATAVQQLIKKEPSIIRDLVKFEAELPEDVKAQLEDTRCIEYVAGEMADLYPNTPLNTYLHQMVVYFMSVEQLTELRDRIISYQAKGLIDWAQGAIHLIDHVLILKGDYV